MSGAEVVIVSNRGPVSFEAAADGSVRPQRGAGGLVSGIAPLVEGSPTIWIAAALTEGDRSVAARGLTEAEGFNVRILDLPPEDYRLAYDVVCNTTLWFLYHGLFDLAREPILDRAWWQAWDAYRRVNDAFATAVADEAPQGATVLVQDYHLSLLGPRLAAARPDLRSVHFSHTPFAGPEAMSVLPTQVRNELLEGMAGHTACGFHTRRWADAFEESCKASIGSPPPTFAAALAPDADGLAGAVASAACEAAAADLDRLLGGRMLIARSDRIELSKNLIRGFEAYGLLLDDHPELRGRVVFGAFVYPSRQGVAAYRRYREAVEAVVASVNLRWGTDDWTPILYDDHDDFPHSLAALRRADVLLVNPIRDGLNLVAKEGPLVNDRDAVLLLSTEAGAWEELGEHAIGLNPYDIVETADALHRALSMSPTERAERAAALQAASSSRTPADWLAAQLQAALAHS